jgi:hypothetical protein
MAIKQPLHEVMIDMDLHVYESGVRAEIHGALHATTEWRVE